MTDLSRLGAWADLPFFKSDWPALEARLADDAREILPPNASRPWNAASPTPPVS